MPDIHEIMSSFLVAQSMLRVCHRSLSLNVAPDGPAEEADVLQEAIEKFRHIYNELDAYAGAQSLAQRTP